MSLKKYFVFLLLCASINTAYAQLNAVTIGNSIEQGNNCYIITEDKLSQAGGVWYDNAINFDSDFTIYYQNNFGNKDGNGADGMALVFKRNATPEIGVIGGGIGYERITPALAVEFDTYQNGERGDPAFDHISIMQGGSSNHNTSNNLMGPVQASATSLNIEDGIAHDIKIEWIASETTLNIYFDCQLRLSLNKDIKTSVFFGDDTVFFGFVGSTGGFSNLHEVCFNSISFVENLLLKDTTICQGSSTSVDATIPSGATYSWTPTTGVSNPNIANPSFSPNTTTKYTVTIGDVCGETSTEEFTLTVLPPKEIPIFDEVTPICQGQTLIALPTTSNNGISGTWSPALNNMATTTYTFTPNAGQGCVLSTTLEIEVIPPNTPTFNSPTSICKGEMVDNLTTVSNEGITGSWSEPINNQTTTTYTFTPDPNQCSSSIDIQIEVIPISELELSIDFTSEPFTDNQSVIATVTNGNGMYEYQLNDGVWGSQNIFTNIIGCDENIIRVRQLNGCSLTVAKTFRVLDYPKFFTPNGDSFNPTWNIDCLKDQTESKITIFDRYGKLLVQISPTGLGWDGMYNGNLMPTDDYWFKVEYFNKDGQPSVFTSNFSLKR